MHLDDTFCLVLKLQTKRSVANTKNTRGHAGNKGGLGRYNTIEDLLTIQKDLKVSFMFAKVGKEICLLNDIF